MNPSAKSQRAYYLKHKDDPDYKARQRETSRRYRERHPERRRANALGRYHANRSQIGKQRAANRKAMKAKVLAHYGPRCRNCLKDDPRVLSIHHLYNNGAEERRESGLDSWRTVFRKGCPDDYCILCRTCNRLAQQAWRDAHPVPVPVSSYVAPEATTLPRLSEALRTMGWRPPS